MFRPTQIFHPTFLVVTLCGCFVPSWPRWGIDISHSGCRIGSYWSTRRAKTAGGFMLWRHWIGLRETLNPKAWTFPKRDWGGSCTFGGSNPFRGPNLEPQRLGVQTWAFVGPNLGISTFGGAKACPFGGPNLETLTFGGPNLGLLGVQTLKPLLQRLGVQTLKPQRFGGPPWNFNFEGSKPWNRGPTSCRR